jgi:hypothetical protein
MADAYNYSVLGMLAVPYLLIGTIGFLLWRSTKAPRPKAPSEGGHG